MRLRKWMLAIGLGTGLTGMVAFANEPVTPVQWIFNRNSCPCPCPPAYPPITGTTPGTPSSGSPATDAQQPPSTNLGAPERLGTDAVAQFTPTMFGDLLASQIVGPLTVTINGVTTPLMRGLPIPPNLFVPGAVFNFDVVLNDGTIITAGTRVPDTGLQAPTAPLPPEPTPPPGPVPARSAGILALVARGAFKIAENESPRPLDRAYLTYNYFYDVDQFHRFGARTDVHRETLGFEKTFMDGNASLGLRLPFVQALGDPDVSQAGVGDITLISKYAFINNLETGSVLSGGLAVTIPTGNGFLPEFYPENIHSFLLQPWVGGIWQSGRFFTQGFSSLIIPTDSSDFTIWFNDIGFGYMVFQTDDPSRFVRYVAPVFETHILTPLNHRGSLRDPYGAPDIVNLTAGTSIGVGQKSFLNIGGVLPVTGPRPFGFEAMVQFNWRF